MNETIVYVSMIADLIHAGHVSILTEASKHGKVIVGLLTEDACREINDVPYLSYENRRIAIAAIGCVSEIIPQESASCLPNLKKIGATIVVHGTDWKTNHLKKYRDEVLDYILEIHGELIEPEYSKEINSINIKEQVTALGITSTVRSNSLRRLLREKKILRILEVHNALSGLIVEHTKIDNTQFDGMWSSSLTDSTSKGKPDIEAVDTTARLTTINEIFEVTTKPMIYDADTGGKPEHFQFTVRSLERVGVSAAIIEDKTGLKKNSLFGNDVDQSQDCICDFCHKIKMGKAAQITKNFMIIARCESLILEKGLEDALERSFAYVNAGADAIMIHSRNKDGVEIFEFIKRFREFDKQTPIVVVPSSFNKIHIDEFEKAGANIVIYANHLLRSAYPAMLKTAKGILLDGKSENVDKTLCMSINDILELIPGTK
ncbi:MAG: phosphoenolpyruvate mutase [Candidatus Pacearchaeota archaeon]|jgi:phosphoenolpyruvate phosphomutase|nr:phosphoenolpyruvate mutase [Clostridia bacterium]